MPELSILKLFLSLSLWQQYRSLLDVSDFPREMQGIVRLIDTYHESHPEGEGLSANDLSNLFFSTPRSDKDREFYGLLFDNLSKNASKEETAIGLVKAIRKNNLLRQASIAAYEAAEGREAPTPPLEVFKAIIDLEAEPEGELAAENDPDFVFVSQDLEELINARKSAPGLNWRLPSLNKILGPLRTGDFGFIFARPETGKTTFLASEVSYMATQTDRPILWFNNEEQGDKVAMRQIQAFLGLSSTELLRDIQANKQAYLEGTGRRICMVDRAAITKRFVEKLVKHFKPGLILFDQIDKIQGFDNDREDLRLGSIYIWARELAKQYCPVIGVCQADGTGEGVRWLTMSHVANAKTAKQAEADWILGIGKSNDIGFENIRYLHASKNKLDGGEETIPEMRHARQEVLIHPEIARYGELG